MWQVFGLGLGLGLGQVLGLGLRLVVLVAPLELGLGLGLRLGLGGQEYFAHWQRPLYLMPRLPPLPQLLFVRPAATCMGVCVGGWVGV